MNFVAKFSGRELKGYELANIRNAYSRQRNVELSRRMSIKPKHRKLHKDYRAKLIETVVSILKEGNPTYFAFEGACRQSVRSLLCIEGWSWGEADTASTEIVLTALNRVGAKRPTWSQGQPEYRGEDFHGTTRRCANPRCGSVLDENQRLYCCEHCGDTVRKRRYEKDHKEQIVAQKRIYKARKRLENPEAFREKQRASREMTLDKHPPRQCLECAKFFKAFPSDPSKYCSQDCRHAKNRVKIMRPCATCGTEFAVTKKSDDRKYCTMKCKYARNIEDKERACPVCRTRFYLKRPSHKTKTCSRACGKILAKRGPMPTPKASNFNCEAVTPQSDAA